MHRPTVKLLIAAGSPLQAGCPTGDSCGRSRPNGRIFRQNENVNVLVCWFSYLKSSIPYIHTKSIIWQVDNVSIQAGSPLEAGSPIQAEGSRSLVPIEAGGLY